MSLLDVLEPLCARGFLRQATQLSLTSKDVAAALPMGTGRQIYEAAEAGNDGQLTVYLEYWRGNAESREVLNWGTSEQSSTQATKSPTLKKAPKDMTVLKGWPKGPPVPDSTPLYQNCASPLVAAARNNRFACVELLASFLPTVNINKGYRTGTALHWACRLGRPAMVRVLLAVPGIAVNQKAASGGTALHDAAGSGHAKSVRLLVAFKGIDLKATKQLGDTYIDQWGQKKAYLTTAVQLAREGKHREVVAVLTEAIKKEDLLDLASMKIFEAARDGNMAVLKPLVEEWSGNDDVLGGRHMVDIPPPIHAACFFDRVDAVRLLISTPGVDVNKVVLDKANAEIAPPPLMVAALKANVEVVGLLLTAQGIEINKRSMCAWCKGKTALAFALYHDAPGTDWTFDQVVEKKQQIEAMLREAGATQ